MKRITREQIAALSDRERRQLKAGINNFMGTMLTKRMAEAKRRIEAGVEDEQEDQSPHPLSS